MLRPPGVTDAPPARRVRGRRSSLVLGVLVLTAVVSTRWVRLNLSPSLPVGLYRLTAVPAEVTRGTLVVLPVPASVQHVWSSWVPLLKPVAGVPGDVVCYAQEARLRSMGAIMARSPWRPTARPLPHLDAGCQPVPEGMVFLASQAPKSLDGRYLGMTPVATLTAQRNTPAYMEITYGSRRPCQQGLRQRVAPDLSWLLGGAADPRPVHAACPPAWRAQVCHWFRAGAQTRAQYRHRTTAPG